MNELDESREVRYWKGTDRLIYSNVEAESNIHVRVVGAASEIKLNEHSSRPAWFILTSPHTARQLKVTCLQGTRAARRLRELTSKNVAVIGLRSLDLARALEDRYRVNLLAADIQALPE